MKNLEVGDGISFGVSHPGKAEEISQMLEDRGYRMYNKTSRRTWGREQCFQWDGECWLSCNVWNITKDLSYKQIKAKILGIIEPQYEIY